MRPSSCTSKAERSRCSTGRAAQEQSLRRFVHRVHITDRRLVLQHRLHAHQLVEVELAFRERPRFADPHAEHATLQLLERRSVFDALEVQQPGAVVRA